jgi:hypothetical protein
MSCALRSYFEQRLALMTSTETVTLSRESLTEILARHESCSCSEATERAAGIRPDTTGPHSAAQVGSVIDRAASTTRNLLADGLCGDPSTLRDLNGEYVVPAARVEQLRTTLDGPERLALGKFCLVARLDDAGESEVTKGAPHRVRLGTGQVVAAEVESHCSAAADTAAAGVAAPTAGPSEARATCAKNGSRRATPVGAPEAMPRSRKARTSALACAHHSADDATTDLGAWRRKPPVRRTTRR